MPQEVTGASIPAKTITPFGGPSRVTDLHVFVAVGQSNMSGHGHPSGGTRDPADPRILQYGANVRTLRLATVPLDMQRVATGLSPATTMAREYLKTQPANVGVLIIPAARGATAFTQFPTFTWSVGAASTPAYDLPALAVKQTRSGLQAARTAGYTVELKGILWHQGEGNPHMSTSKYSAELDRLIAFFRANFAAPRLPFVVGRMAPEAIAAMPGLANIDRAHRETPGRVAYTGFAPSRAGGVNAGESIHFSRIGVEYLGKTYLAAYRQAAVNAPKSKSARQ
jgi:Carbohydrate esterase, sialic acid-specific acetylesterase